MLGQNGLDTKKVHRSKVYDYCYCSRCGKIRYEVEIDVSGEKPRCRICGGLDLEAPKWVECPHRKTMVKCVTAGAGLIRSKLAYECADRCKVLSGETE